MKRGAHRNKLKKSFKILIIAVRGTANYRIRGGEWRGGKPLARMVISVGQLVQAPISRRNSL